jgi:hypothetical protein
MPPAVAGFVGTSLQSGPGAHAPVASVHGVTSMPSFFSMTAMCWSRLMKRVPPAQSLPCPTSPVVLPTARQP